MNEDEDMPHDQSGMELQIQEISKDSALFSLFNQGEAVLANHHMEDQGQPRHHHQFIPQQLNLDPEAIERGYWSDCKEDPSRSRIRKHKQIINKKEKKRTRHRTRMYIEMLENRVAELQSQIDKLKKLNKINKQYIHRLGESEHIINGFFVGRQQLYENLETTPPTGDNQKQIFENLQSLRLRQGVFGKDRLKAVNYYFKEMVEMMLPEIQKYIAKTAVEQSDFFDKEFLMDGEHRGEGESWRKSMLEKIDIGSEDITTRQYFDMKRPKVLEQTRKFQQMLLKFYEMKCSLSEQARNMQAVLDDAHTQMTLTQITQALCYIDRYRFQKNITLEQSVPEVFERLKHENLSYNTSQLFQTRKVSTDYRSQPESQK